MIGTEDSPMARAGNRRHVIPSCVTAETRRAALRNCTRVSNRMTAKSLAFTRMLMRFRSTSPRIPHAAPARFTLNGFDRLRPAPTRMGYDADLFSEHAPWHDDEHVHVVPLSRAPSAETPSLAQQRSSTNKVTSHLLHAAVSTNRSRSIVTTVMSSCCPKSLAAFTIAAAGCVESSRPRSKPNSSPS